MNNHSNNKGKDDIGSIDFINYSISYNYSLCFIY